MKPGDAVEVYFVWAATGAGKCPLYGWFRGYEFVRDEGAKKTVIVRQTSGALAGPDIRYPRENVRRDAVQRKRVPSTEGVSMGKHVGFLVLWVALVGALAAGCGSVTVAEDDAGAAGASSQGGSGGKFWAETAGAAGTLTASSQDAGGSGGKSDAGGAGSDGAAAGAGGPGGVDACTSSLTVGWVLVYQGASISCSQAGAARARVTLGSVSAEAACGDAVLTLAALPGPGALVLTLLAADGATVVETSKTVTAPCGPWRADLAVGFPPTGA